ncbi:hypothetical protein KIK06_14315 [Nocardiopsis sp. EMB25]|uniref:hypothetical protein n=1 Tax=Nocardiopsis sp. EMB25 TaxID=2835867 RepID=UPI002283C659|nr:hypothetical protein [Nocardiopsis sp. EMB25]MCY9785058.1 hypothetical protein [Nocardiopsis sp. EMB25]
MTEPGGAVTVEPGVGISEGVDGEWRTHANEVEERVQRHADRIAGVWEGCGNATGLSADLTGVIPRARLRAGREDAEDLARRVYRGLPFEIRLHKARKLRGVWYEALFRDIARRRGGMSMLRGPRERMRWHVEELALELEAGLGEVRRAHALTGSAGRCCEYDFLWVDYLLVTDDWVVVLHVGELD